MSHPTHLAAGGSPRMVDVAGKDVTERRAVARSIVRMRPDVLRQLVDAGGPKGDAFVVARLAGINAAKRTADLIPLCHPLPLDVVEVGVETDAESGTVTLIVEARATARTGVEMEALVAASVSALTLYDMAKALQRDIAIERIELVSKSGGASGEYERDGAGAPAVPDVDVALPTEVHDAVVVTCSNRSAAGERDDESGPGLVRMLRDAGLDTAPRAIVVPDDEATIATLIARLADAGHRLVITTGGTGLSPTDVTPRATRRVIDREAPGIAEMMRAAGLTSTPLASLSSGVVGVRGRTLVANLPGSPRGARESLTALLPVLGHALEQLSGADHHAG